MGSNKSKSVILSSQDMLQGLYSDRPKVSEQIPDSITKVMIQYVNGEIDSLFIDSTLRCGEFKELLFRKVSKTLMPNCMILKLNGKRIADNEILGQLLGIDDLVVQERVPLSEISRIQYHSSIYDDFTTEKGTAKMPCGHMIGRQAVKQFIRTIIRTKKCKLTCPYPECVEEWSYDLCRTVGCFTKNEDKELTEGLNKNWMEMYTKNCPGCKNAVVNENKENNKWVHCSNPKCKFGPFCFSCLKKWKNKNSYTSCGNVDCEFFQDFYKKDNTTKEFTFFDPETASFVVKQVPSYRLCPQCKTSIEHAQGCKHMKCPNCECEFCFVCLDVLKKDWKCGAFNRYCGFVAEKQKI